MNKIELLAPLKNINYLKEVVGSGADCVYLGTKEFNCRVLNNDNNFTERELIDAIKYCKENNVKVYLTLNILIKEEEFLDALKLADLAYRNGVSAIIVQDLGLAEKLIKNYPDLSVHASTQTTITNSYGVEAMSELGFKRVILSRELSLSEINILCKKSKIEIETFIHGGLCISYSGQCLFSSFNYGLAGNRGKCVGTCRNNMLLCKNNKIIKSGKLLKPRDLCGIEYLQDLIENGVSCLKIQGRTRGLEYIKNAIEIYRKYIDLAYSDKEYKIDSKDIEKLKSISSRGLTTGYFNEIVDKDLITNQEKIEISKEKNNTIKYRLLDSNYNKNDISILLNNINNDFDFKKLTKDITRIYIPIEKFFAIKPEDIKDYKTYIYMPLVILERDIDNYISLIDKILNRYDIEGFVLSNYSDLQLIKKYKNKYKFITNYSFNVYNSNTCNELKNQGVDIITHSIELNNSDSKKISTNYNNKMERIIYGKVNLFNMRYDLLDVDSDGYYINIDNDNGNYDVLKLKQGINTRILSSKILSIGDYHYNDSLRLDFNNESIDEINKVIKLTLNRKYISGNNYKNDVDVE